MCCHGTTKNQRRMNIRLLLTHRSRVLSACRPHCRCGIHPMLGGGRQVLLRLKVFLSHALRRFWRVKVFVSTVACQRRWKRGEPP
jgi:hypothetical protein